MAIHLDGYAEPSEVFLFPDGTDYVCLLAYGEGGNLLATHRDSFAFVKH